MERQEEEKLNSNVAEINEFTNISDKYSCSFQPRLSSLKTILFNDNKLNIIDHIVETLHFSRFHLATIFVASFSLICDGILQIHTQMSRELLMKKYQWEKSTVDFLYVAEMLFMVLGGLISTNSRSINWDVSSNILVGAIGCLSILMITIYSDPFTYTGCILTFCICHGFIGNICTNYLLEILNKRTRGFFFLLISSFRLLGSALNVFIFLYLFGVNQIHDPSIIIIVLASTELSLTISLIYLLDSPRVLFHNNDLTSFYEYILEITDEGTDPIYNQQYKSAVICKLDTARKEIELNYGSQKNEGTFNSYLILFDRKYFPCMTAKAIMFILISGFFVFNLKDASQYFYEYYGLKNEYTLNIKNILITDGRNGEEILNYALAAYYLSQFIFLVGLSLIYYFLPSVKRLIFTVTSIGICFLFMLLILFLKNYFIYFICIFETFAYFNYSLVYLYLSENTTTKLRNSLTSIMFLFASIVNIIEYFMIPFAASYDPNILLYINFALATILILVEIFMIHVQYDTKDLHLQEIEFRVLRNTKSF